MDFKFISRLLLIGVIIAIFYINGLPLELTILWAIFLLAFILLRGKIWSSAEKAIQKFLPFTKNWPAWTQKLILILIFFLIYFILKEIVYFALGLAGFNIQEAISNSLIK